MPIEYTIAGGAGGRITVPKDSRNPLKFFEELFPKSGVNRVDTILGTDNTMRHFFIFGKDGEEDAKSFTLGLREVGVGSRSNPSATAVAKSYEHNRVILTDEDIDQLRRIHKMHSDLAINGFSNFYVTAARGHDGLLKKDEKEITIRFYFPDLEEARKFSDDIFKKGISSIQDSTRHKGIIPAKSSYVEKSLASLISPEYFVGLSEGDMKKLKFAKTLEAAAAISSEYDPNMAVATYIPGEQFGFDLDEPQATTATTAVTRLVAKGPSKGATQ